MKYLLVFAVVMLVAWRWRTVREAQKSSTHKTSATASAAPLAMVRCEHCGVHVPAGDAVQGARGMYCSAAHQQKAEP